jgi:DinB superfamily
MKRVWMMIMAISLVSACALNAQEANPISASLKQDWSNISGLLTKMSDKMPDENYRFKPTPEMQDFGQRMAHVVGFNMRNCAQLKGDQKSITFSAMPTKAEIVAAVKQTNEECDALFSSLTDADLAKMVTARNGQRLELAVIQGNLLEHSQEMYGYLAVYLRLKGIVPPSSDHNEH